MVCGRFGARGLVAGLMLAAGLSAGADARCSEPTWPARFTAQVVRVKDGDSLVVRNPGFEGPAERTLRLHGIDAPEFDQPYGREARDRLRERVRGRRLAFEAVANDRYCRLLVRAAPPGAAADALNLALVEAGLAWADDRLPDARYARAQRAAAEARRGLWADPAPVPPALWRRVKAARSAGSGARP